MMKTSTKMYLMVVVSTACIFLYQYQLTRSRLIDPSELQHIDNNSDNKNNIQNRNNNKNLDGNNIVIPNDIGLDISINHEHDYINNNFKINNNGINGKILARHLTLAEQIKTVTTTIQTTATTDPKTINSKDHPPLYIITPTFRRPEQLAELTRLGYTLKHVPNLYWLVIEDATTPTPLVTKLLKHIGVPFEHLIAPMPDKYRANKIKPRGVANRNRGLSWIRANATEGVLYFADDDNTYDITIFNEMRYTKKVSMWPVGLITKYGVSSPIVINNTFIGFYDGWFGGRRYPVDMAGFAVNVKFLLSRPKAVMPFKPGYEEDGFLKSLGPLQENEIELLASGCTEILTWHTQTKKNQPATKLDMKKYKGTNLIALKQILV